MGKTPVRFSVNTAQTLESNSDMDAILGLVPVLARGLPTPTGWLPCCWLCNSGNVPIPTGVSCLDRGLNSQTKWMPYKDMVKFTSPSTGGDVGQLFGTPQYYMPNYVAPPPISGNYGPPQAPVQQA